MRILVADDHRAVANGMAAALEMHGHEVQTAYDGLSAARLAEEFLPDAAILDLRMAHLSGFEVAERLRALNCLRTGCLIALTGQSAEEEESAGREAEFDHFLLKPAEPNQVLALLDAYGMPPPAIAAAPSSVPKF